MKNLANRAQPYALLGWSILFFLLLWISCRELPIVNQSYYPLADFEEQESTLICWNNKHKNVQLPVIAAMAKKDHVTIFYNERRHLPQHIQLDLLQANINIKNVSLEPFQLEKDNIWIRDYGPTFLQDEAGNTIITGFQYPHLTNKDYNQFSEQYSSKVRLPFFKSNIFGAGGGREINGEGTIILVESYEKEINRGLTKAEIEQEYRDQFNQEKIIWLKRGIPQDDFFGHGPIFENIYGYGVAGHVDEFCRFADANTLLLAEVDSSDLERDSFYHFIGERLEENYRILSAATDQDGRPFKIVRVPQAPVIFATGDLDSTDILFTPVTSYLNFIITNNLVIIPAYYQPGDPDYVRAKDEQALEIFKRVFPTREVATVNPLSLNYDGGGLHCITLPKHGKSIRKKRLKKRLM